jgi:hypothetical protein
MNTHPILADDLLFIGCGSTDPRIFALSSARPDQPPQHIADFKDRGSMLSVYALALSPAQRYLAASSRPILDRVGQVSHPSILRIYPIHQGQEITLGLPVLDTFQMAGICGVDVTDEGLVVAACGDGSLRVYSSLSSDSPLAEIKAHSGFAFAACWVEPGKVLASYGQDGTLKFFEFPGGSTIYSSPPCPVTANAALTSLALDRARGVLYYGCGSGHLHITKAQGGETQAVEAHDGGILAVAYHPLVDKIITGGQMDGRLCVWTPGNFSRDGETSLGTPVLGLVPLAEGKIAVLDGNSSVSLYSIEPSITFVSRLASLSARSWAGPDLAPLADQRHRTLLKTLIDSREKARASIQAGDKEGALAEIRNLAEKGYGVDAMVLHAALCRRLGMLLLEYRIWQDLRNQLSGKLPGEPCEYLFAELLELMMEPRLSAEVFRKLETYHDSALRAERLEHFPLYREDVANLVRCDFVKPEQVLEEIEKCNILAKPFPWVVFIQGSLPESIAYAPDLSQLAKDLENRYDRRYGNWKIVVEERQVFKDGVLRNAHWLRVRLADQGPPLGCLDVALEISESNSGCQRTSHVFFCANRFLTSEMSYHEWNGKVADWWHTVWSSDEAKKWADAAHRVISSIFVGAIHTSQAQNDSGF